MKLLESFGIDTIIDVGANSGQYALEMLYYGFQGNIMSFEPISSVFKKLEKNSKRYQNWRAFNWALGEKEGQAEINITNHTPSSSILTIADGRIDAFDGIYAVTKEKICVRTLSSVWDDIIKVDINKNIYLKIDTQGYERYVLAGGEEVLRNIKAIQLEMSFKELYEGAWLYTDALEYLRQWGFSLQSLEPSFFDEKTGRLLEMDGIFLNEKYRDAFSNNSGFKR